MKRDYKLAAVASGVGRLSIMGVAELGDAVLFIVFSLVGAPHSRGQTARLTRAIYTQGVRCTPVVVIVGLFTGLVLGLQGFYVLARFGSESLLGSLVSLTLTRELGPVLAALMVVGQSGSAIAAELGIQRNSEQIAALETMGVNTFAYLIAPPVLASIIIYPILTAFFVLVGLLGGLVSGSFVLSLPSGVYCSSVAQALHPQDVRECLVKAVVFGFITTAICCYNGYNAHRRSGSVGAQAVSASTTRAVVLSSVSILAADYIITSLLVFSHHA